MNKYQEALDNIADKLIDCGRTKDLNGETILKEQSELNLLQELVDNPPLKFENLKEGMWIWDDKTKSYIYIFKPLDWKPVKGIRYASHIITNSVEGYYMDFEESRFYHREVSQEGQENE